MDAKRQSLKTHKLVESIAERLAAVEKAIVNIPGVIVDAAVNTPTPAPAPTPTPTPTPTPPTPGMVQAEAFPRKDRPRT